MVFENKKQPLVTRLLFARRMLLCSLVSSIILMTGLSAGVLGYRLFAGLPWVDSLLNASMILTGMGPVDPMKTTSAKIFASVYALFSGIVFLTATAVTLSPIFHRILHHFHLSDEDLLDETP